MAKKIGGQVNLPMSRVRNILLEADVAICDLLKERGRVTLNGFGNFYIIERKSRIIKQIGTKTPRLLLNSREIKFKSMPDFKATLAGRSPEQIRQQNFEQRQKEKEAKTKISHIKVKDVSIPITAEKPQKSTVKLNFKTLSILPRVQKEKIELQIRERILKVARKQKEANKNQNGAAKKIQTPDGKIFVSLIKKLAMLGADNFCFSLGENEKIDIYYSRPRKSLGKIPKTIVLKFLDKYLNLTHFNLPQERFVIVANDSKISGRIYLRAHLLPTNNGASVYLKFNIKNE
ncbi:MAG: HU family DNA-binding protein [Candidatus Berkelbacteria bacterium]|nr:HU family DNA-binding protein [Candidatus Berkelbacteria bacterium]